MSSMADQPDLAPGRDPARQLGDGHFDQMGKNFVLGKYGIGRRRDVQQQNEQQRPEDRVTRLAHSRRRVVAHQQVGQRRRADGQAENQRQEIDAQ
jgi:hypothetical protein